MCHKMNKSNFIPKKIAQNAHRQQWEKSIMIQFLETCIFMTTELGKLVPFYIAELFKKQKHAPATI